MRKKDRETAALKMLQRYLPDFPQGQVEQTETPDFLVRTNSGVLGIELTLLHRDTPDGKSPMQEQEALQRQILQKTKELYDSRNGPPIHVTVHFNPNYRLRKRDVGTVPTSIMNLVLDAMQTDGKCEIKEDEGNWETFPQAIAYVHPYRHCVLKQSTWCPISAEFVPALPAEQLQRAIDKKNLRCATYKRRCSEIWLLLVAEGSGLSSMFGIPPELRSHRFCTSFDKVLLLGDFDGRVIELTTGKHEGQGCP